MSPSGKGTTHGKVVCARNTTTRQDNNTDRNQKNQKTQKPKKEQTAMLYRDAVRHMEHREKTECCVYAPYAIRTEPTGKRVRVHLKTKKKDFTVKRVRHSDEVALRLMELELWNAAEDGRRTLDPYGKSSNILPERLHERYLQACARYAVVENERNPPHMSPESIHFDDKTVLLAKITDTTAFFRCRDDPSLYTTELMCEAIRRNHAVYSFCSRKMRADPTVHSVFLDSLSRFKRERARENLRKLRKAARTLWYLIKWMEDVAERKYHPKADAVQEWHRSEVSSMFGNEPGTHAHEDLSEPV